MASIVVTMKDGTVRKFLHEGRAGGSYTKLARYEGGFVIIKDEWDNETAIPAENVQQVEVTQTRR